MNHLSFIIPVYNEEENIKRLVEEINDAIKILNMSFEIILVDDASTDNSLAVIKTISSKNSSVKYISFLKNAGQSAALYAGIQHAKGNIIITMDADLQNDPADIPGMVKYYGKYDMITGWRYKRMDSFAKKIGSRIGNYVRNKLTGEMVHDTGCSLKIMNAEMLKKIKLYKGLHRFLPTLMKMEGAKVKEVKVGHRPRKYGVSKYSNLRRGLEGIHDDLAVRWMKKRYINVEVREKNV